MLQPTLTLKVPSIIAGVETKTGAGLAVQPYLLLPKNRNAALNYTEAALIATGADPCENCKLLIQKLKMEVGNFAKPK